ncbi:thioredoxin [Youngiibacter fragilis]|uniref:Thioredoxin n=1 Tax=Youngiibacter fragilis 232.1 TaxID=994573 RepID=V7HZH3_9CLOT|nr:thioredoxin [Youngiibacter fragilis]ETA79385.1 thioredoxin [Youngiibacter fragilis 232.1]
MREISDATFESEVLNKKGMVLVDFWAPWCGPCRMVAPVMEELSREYEGRLEVVKLNVDNNPKVSQSLRITSIPTIILFKDGKAVDGTVGVRPKEFFQDIIKKNS